MDWVDRCVGGRVARAMGDAGIGVVELARGMGIDERILVDRLAAPATFTACELIVAAGVLGCDAVGLLPDARCRECVESARGGSTRLSERYFRCAR
ncbi:hypothetical protein Ntsu_01540 [Nocardia sp. IFM 10818]